MQGAHGAGKTGHPLAKEWTLTSHHIQNELKMDRGPKYKSKPCKTLRRRQGHKLYDTRLAMTWLCHQGLDDKRKNGPIGLHENFKNVVHQTLSLEYKGNLQNRVKYL